LTGDKKSYAYAESDFMESHPRVSPDSRWLAYVSNETKRDEVYVGTFPMPGRKWQVSVNGGGFPV
jgi:Tol biopolymer transport system component